ncbi:MAG TPA: hypothetical protein VFA97_10750 [Gaiellaceae bacterium]|nr:hypothetical protein [Gaiellaceae bacterium]
MRLFVAALVAGLALAAATAPVGGATNECNNIQQCIHVPGPWVVVPAHGTAQYLLSCPKGGSVVGGLDAQVTSRDVHVSFDGRLGAPVSPGQTTTRYALFRAVSTSAKVQVFQPLLGCIPTQGGGGRSTVSARVSAPGLPLEYRSRIVVIGPGDVKFARVACLPSEQLVGAWHAVAFRTKKPPDLAGAKLVSARHSVVGRRVVVTASSTDALSPDAHAIVQGGAECAS